VSAGNDTGSGGGAGGFNGQRTVTVMMMMMMILRNKVKIREDCNSSSATISHAVVHVLGLELVKTPSCHKITYSVGYR
jgi:hypothetical protein